MKYHSQTEVQVVEVACQTEAPMKEVMYQTDDNSIPTTHNHDVQISPFQFAPILQSYEFSYFDAFKPNYPILLQFI